MSYSSYSKLGRDSATQDTSSLYNVEEVKTEKEKRTFINTNDIVCIDVYASWCNPCKKIYPAYTALAKKYNDDRCVLVKEDYDLGLSQDVTAIPAFLFYKKGVKVAHLTGANLEDVEETLKNLLDTLPQKQKISVATTAGGIKKATPTQTPTQTQTPSKMAVHNRVIGEAVSSNRETNSSNREEFVSPSISRQFGATIRGGNMCNTGGNPTFDNLMAGREDKPTSSQTRTDGYSYGYLSKYDSKM